MMRAGDVIQTLDVPPPATDGSDSNQLNLTNTSFQAGSPEVSTTFVAPTSGAVLVIVGGGLRDNSSTNRVIIAPEVRETDSSGDIVLAAGIAANSWTNSQFQTTGYQYGSRMVPLTGLTPGATYFARVMQRVSGGSTADVFSRQIFIVPTAG